MIKSLRTKVDARKVDARLPESGTDTVQPSRIGSGLAFEFCVLIVMVVLVATAR